MLLVYDGDCGLCTRVAHWAAQRLPDDARVEPHQRLVLEEHGLSADDVAAAAWWIDSRGRRHRGHIGAARALIAMGGAWRVAGLLVLTPPLRWLARAGYRLTAHNRHRLGGQRSSCAVGR